MWQEVEDEGDRKMSDDLETLHSSTVSGDRDERLAFRLLLREADLCINALCEKLAPLVRNRAYRYGGDEGEWASANGVYNKAHETLEKIRAALG
jgi:hypothetical protein